MIFLAFLALPVLASDEAAGQDILDVGAIVDELAEAAAFVTAHTALTEAPRVEVPDGGRLVISQHIFSADSVELGVGAELLLDTAADDERQDFFLVARRLVVPAGAEGASIGWVGAGASEAPTALGRAPNGADGKGAGQDGGNGRAGQAGRPGLQGVAAPRLTLVVLQMEGDALLVDLGGGNGGPGGVGQAGGHGGNGARGNAARTAWVKFFGGKTAAGCAAGPGRGGRGGDVGAGGPGGVGGDGGPGGIFRIVGPGDVTENFFEIGEVDVSPGEPGRGGAGGEAGRPGRGGPEGHLSQMCSSAGRQGNPGKPASNGYEGSLGKQAGSGTVSRIDLDAGRLSKAFGFGAEDG